MVTGTVVLLGGASGLGPADLAAVGIAAIDAGSGRTTGDLQGQLTAVVLAVRAAAPADPLLLLAAAHTGAQMPAFGRALANAGRRIGGYLFLDASLPGRPDPGRIDPVQVGDWPDAPCGYLRTSVEFGTEERSARLRGWPTVDLGAGGSDSSPAAGIAVLIELM